MGRIAGGHIGRELLRLHRLEELQWAELWVITLREHLRLHRLDALQWANVGDHIGRELLRLHRVEGLQWAELSVITLGGSSCDSLEGFNGPNCG